MKAKILDFFRAVRWFFYDINRSICLGCRKLFRKNGDKKTKLSAMKRMRIIFIIVMFIYPLFQLILFWVVPNIDALIMGFTRFNRQSKAYEFSFVWFKMIFQDLFKSGTYLNLAMINSFIYFFAINVIGIPLTLLLSYFIYKKIFLHKMFRVIFFLPSVISGVVLATLFSSFVGPTGPVTQLLAKIMGVSPEYAPSLLGDDKYKLFTICFYTLWTGFGVNLIMFNSAIARVPTDVIEYGKLEGLSMTRELFQVIVPMIVPTLNTVIILGVAGIFTFIQPVMLLSPLDKTGNPSMQSSIAYYIYWMFHGQSSRQPEFASAVGVFCAIIGVPLVMLTRFVMNKITYAVEY